jgi:membrane fusion protein (multidrug efflux system)
VAEIVVVDSVKSREAGFMRLKILAFGLLVPAMLGATSCSNDEQKPAAAPPASVAPARPAPAASLAEPIPSRPNALEILTVLSVENSVELLAQIDGIVTEIAFDQDSWVEKGAVLARIDDRALQAKLNHARDDLEIARNNLKYQEAETQAKDAAYRRQLELRKFGLSSAAAEEEAEFLSKGAHYDVDSLTATVKEKESEIQELQVELEKTRIVAPFEGYVAQRSIRVGQNLVKNDPCFRVSQLSPLQVRFLVPESTGAAPQLGNPLRVVPVGDNTREYEAAVKLVSPTIDPASMSYDVTAQLTGPDLSHLRPGMAVKVLWPARNQPTVP